MTAPTWTLLAPDAPEPGPLSVVRDKDGDWWVHGPGPSEAHWWCLGGALDEDTGAGTQTNWDGVQENAPLELGRDPEDHAPWCPPIVAADEPTPYEVRRDALNAAAERLNGWEGDHTDDLERADRYVAWLRAEPGA